MRLLFVTLLLVPGPALLAAAPDGERTRLVAERRVLSERFATEESACAKRFAVTACVDDTRARRRAALAPLRERELRLDEAERQQRGADRRAAIASKVAAAASRPVVAEPGAAASAASASVAAATTPVVRLRALGAAASSAARVPRLKEDEAARAAQAAQRVREAEARQQETTATQERIERRLADRAKKGLKSDPLPLPLPLPLPASGR